MFYLLAITPPDSYPYRTEHLDMHPSTV